MIVKLLTEHHLEFPSLKGDCRGLSESTQVKLPHCWKSHALAHTVLAGRPFKGNIKNYLVSQHHKKEKKMFSTNILCRFKE